MLGANGVQAQWQAVPTGSEALCKNSCKAMFFFYSFRSDMTSARDGHRLSKRSLRMMVMEMDSETCQCPTTK